MELTFLLLPVGHVGVFRDVVDQSIGKDLLPVLDILFPCSGPQSREVTVLSYTGKLGITPQSILAPLSVGIG